VTLVGLGGVWAEALYDVRVLPVDLDLDEISEEIGKLRGAPLLRCWRRNLTFRRSISTL
jgi:hypothetical protein